LLCSRSTVVTREGPSFNPKTAVAQSEQTWRGALQRRAIKEKAMNKELLAKLGKTKSVTLPAGVVRTLDDSELASVVGGMRATVTRSNSCSGGCEDDCVD
jgi:hypothetical protein